MNANASLVAALALVDTLNAKIGEGFAFTKPWSSKQHNASRALVKAQWVRMDLQRALGLLSVEDAADPSGSDTKANAAFTEAATLLAEIKAKIETDLPTLAAGSVEQAETTKALKAVTKLERSLTKALKEATPKAAPISLEESEADADTDEGFEGEEDDLGTEDEGYDGADGSEEIEDDGETAEEPL